MSGPGADGSRETLAPDRLSKARSRRNLVPEVRPATGRRLGLLARRTAQWTALFMNLEGASSRLSCVDLRWQIVVKIVPGYDEVTR